jgi:ketosteroid isomerase-like protein
MVGVVGLSALSRVPDAGSVAEASTILDHRTGQRGSVDAWVAAFAEVWSAPRRELDRLMALLSPEIVLKAPTTPPRTDGQADGRRAFERAFRAMPDLRATVHRWSATGDVLFVEMTFEATIGGHPVRWSDVDRILFRDGSAVERVAYFNPAKVRRAFLRNPSAFRQFLRLRLGH